MDLREKKTKRNITNAFLVLRKKKPLERITVKELAELAEISKATFYLHYKDIYDLSETLQNEVILNILNGLPNPENYMNDYEMFVRELFLAFHAQQNLVEILFSGTQASILPYHIEREIKTLIHRMVPQNYIDSEKKDAFDIMLTYQIYGTYHVYQLYHDKCDMEELIKLVSSFSNIDM